MSRPRGFTLIELLVVLSIMALLFAIGMTALRSVSGMGEKAKTAAQLAMLKGMLEQYRTARGDYPPSSLAKLGVRSSNTLFEGNEALVLAFAAKTYSGERIPEDSLSTNLDGDLADKNISYFATPNLPEVVDAWGNPIVYLQHESYAMEQEYEFVEQATSEKQTVRVKAIVNPMTGGFYNPESYQLISCGEDGVFGTGDDIMSFTPANNG